MKWPPIMSLSDLAIRSAKHGPKPIKLADERGLFLLLQPSGGKLWRLKYRFAGKEKKLGLGRYPDITLKEARTRRDEARAQVATGVDPAAHKQAEALAANLNAAATFKLIGDEYLDKASREGRAAVTIKKSRWLLSLMEPDLGALPIADITPAQLLEALRKVEIKGHLETARRMRSLAGRIFRYAVATSRATSDPSALLRGALIALTVKHHLAHDFTKLSLQAACRLDCLTNRVGIKRRSARHVAAVDHVDRSAAIGRSVAGEEGKEMRDLLVGPVASERDEMTAHGFRAMAATLLNEMGLWNPDAIEKQLAHLDGSMVRRAYTRGEYWEERVRMMQHWSDHIDKLRGGAKIITGRLATNQNEAAVCTRTLGI